jgi:hypothetical protein
VTWSSIASRVRGDSAAARAVSTPASVEAGKGSAASVTRWLGELALVEERGV